MTKVEGTAVAGVGERHTDSMPHAWASRLVARRVRRVGLVDADQVEL
jgi:hypothetical protein